MPVREEAKVRAVGVCWYEGRILFQKAHRSSNWVLPGARLEYASDSQDALRASLQKFLAADIDIGTVLYVIENYFESEGEQHQELGVYYEFQFKPEFAGFYEKYSFESIEGMAQFEWIEEGELASRAIAPALVKELLANPPLQMQFLVQKD